MFKLHLKSCHFLYSTNLYCIFVHSEHFFLYILYFHQLCMKFPLVSQLHKHLILHVFSLLFCSSTRCVVLSHCSLFYCSSVQSLSHVQLLTTPWTAARQAFLSISNPWSLPKLMSTELVMPSNHLILCGPLLLLPPIFPSIRDFSNDSALCIR